MSSPSLPTGLPESGAPEHASNFMHWLQEQGDERAQAAALDESCYFPNQTMYAWICDRLRDLESVRLDPARHARVFIKAIERIRAGNDARTLVANTLIGRTSGITDPSQRLAAMKAELRTLYEAVQAAIASQTREDVAEAVAAKPAEAAPAPRESAVTPPAPRVSVVADIEAVIAALPPAAPPAAPAALPPPESAAEGAEKLPILVFKITKPDGDTEELTLQQNIIKIGKVSTMHLRLDDERVSRMHAVIECSEDEKVAIIDLGSLNGTFVNDKKIKKCELHDGDVITVGDTKIEVHFQIPAESVVAWASEEDRKITKLDMGMPMRVAAQERGGVETSGALGSALPPAPPPAKAPLPPASPAEAAPSVVQEIPTELTEEMRTEIEKFESPNLIATILSPLNKRFDDPDEKAKAVGYYRQVEAAVCGLNKFKCACLPDSAKKAFNIAYIWSRILWNQTAGLGIVPCAVLSINFARVCSQSPDNIKYAIMAYVMALVNILEEKMEENERVRLLGVVTQDLSDKNLGFGRLKNKTLLDILEQMNLRLPEALSIDDNRLLKGAVARIRQILEQRPLLTKWFGV